MSQLTMNLDGSGVLVNGNMIIGAGFNISVDGSGLTNLPSSTTPSLSDVLQVGDTPVL